MPVVLDLAPLERHACDLIRYFRSCTEHWSGPRAGRGLQATEQPQVSFPRQWLPFRRQFSPSLVRRQPFRLRQWRPTALALRLGAAVRQFIIGRIMQGVKLAYMGMFSYG